MKIILGIDPGSIITGYGIIQCYNNNIVYLFSGCIYLKNNNFFDKLKIIYNKIKDIIKEFNPNYSVIEQIFIGKNSNSVLKLSQARSAALIALINLNIPVFEYNMSQVKKYIFRDINDKKINLKYIIKDILNLPSIDIKQDVADALAIAITHYIILKDKNFEFN